MSSEIKSPRWSRPTGSTQSGANVIKSPGRYCARTVAAAASHASSPGTAPASCRVAQISQSEITTNTSAGTAASGLAGNTPKLLQSHPVRLYAVLFAIGLVVYGVVAWD